MRPPRCCSLTPSRSACDDPRHLRHVPQGRPRAQHDAEQRGGRQRRLPPGDADPHCPGSDHPPPPRRPGRRARLRAEQFRDSDYWGPNGTPQARGWARVIRELYDVYDGLAQGDARRAFAYGVERDIDLSPDALAIRADIVLLDPRGYVPRVVLWDKNDLSPARATAYGAPVWRAMEDELGDGRVAEVEVWSLRGPDHFVISPAQARAARCARSPRSCTG